MTWEVGEWWWAEWFDSAGPEVVRIIGPPLRPDMVRVMVRTWNCGNVEMSHVRLIERVEPPRTIEEAT